MADDVLQLLKERKTIDPLYLLRLFKSPAAIEELRKDDIELSQSCSPPRNRLVIQVFPSMGIWCSQDRLVKACIVDCKG